MNGKPFAQWLGRTLRFSLDDGRILQGQFVGVDNELNILIRYSEFLEGTYLKVNFTV